MIVRDLNTFGTPHRRGDCVGAKTSPHQSDLTDIGRLSQNAGAIKILAQCIGARLSQSVPGLPTGCDRRLKKKENFQHDQFYLAHLCLI